MDMRDMVEDEIGEQAAKNKNKSRGCKYRPGNFILIASRDLNYIPLIIIILSIQSQIIIKKKIFSFFQKLPELWSES